MRKVMLVVGPGLVGVLVLVSLLAWAPHFARVAKGATPQSITIDASKPRGPFPGTWTASGLINDSGSFHAQDLRGSAIGAPEFLIVHVIYVLEGAHGTINIDAQITETQTADPLIFTGTGNWVILSGTGAYATLHGQGTVVGTVDEHLNLITRTYTGTAHFD